MGRIKQAKLEKIAKSIRENISEMQSVFREISFRCEFVHSILKSTDEGVSDEEEITKDLQERFSLLAKRLFNLGKVFFEIQKVPKHRTEYITHVVELLKSDEQLYLGKYNEDSGDEYSSFLETIRDYFLPFPEFMADATEEKLYLIGRTYLEYILRDTAGILQRMGNNPTKETEVYGPVSIVLRSTFPDHRTPDFIFMKAAKCYFPDILLPALRTAVEYKYAKTEKELNQTIDDILIDVPGYSSNMNYDHFYAVFYTKPGAASEDRFKVLWEEKNFPSNWHPIYVLGR